LSQSRPLFHFYDWMTGLLTRVTQLVPLVDQKLITILGASVDQKLITILGAPVAQNLLTILGAPEIICGFYLDSCYSIFSFLCFVALCLSFYTCFSLSWFCLYFFDLQFLVSSSFHTSYLWQPQITQVGDLKSL
jgi:hypothetical protein